MATVTRMVKPPLPPMVSTYRSSRDQLVGETGVRATGELVPEASGWPLLESLVRTGYLREAVVSTPDFIAAVKQYCPELGTTLGTQVGIDPTYFQED